MINFLDIFSTHDVDTHNVNSENERQLASYSHTLHESMFPQFNLFQVTSCNVPRVLAPNIRKSLLETQRNSTMETSTRIWYRKFSSQTETSAAGSSSLGSVL